MRAQATAEVSAKELLRRRKSKQVSTSSVKDKCGVLVRFRVLPGQARPAAPIRRKIVAPMPRKESESSENSDSQGFSGFSGFSGFWDRKLPRATSFCTATFKYTKGLIARAFRSCLHLPLNQKTAPAEYLQGTGGLFWPRGSAVSCRGPCLSQLSLRSNKPAPCCLKWRLEP